MGPEYFKKKQGYAQQGGPLPNDEYGDAHRQVQPAYSQGLNEDVSRFDATDGNLQTYDGMYGGAQAGGGGFDRAYTMLHEAYGPEMAAEVIDDLMRVRAQEDVHGPREQPDFSQMPPAQGVPQQEAPPASGMAQLLRKRGMQR